MNRKAGEKSGSAEEGTGAGPGAGAGRADRTDDPVPS